MKKYTDIFLINSIAIMVAMLFYYLLNEKPEIPIAIIATGISISFGIRQSMIENDKIFKELFISFNQKYDEKFNNLLNEIVTKNIGNSEYQLTQNEVKLVKDYLNFCAEEYLWYSKGRIDESVWLSWENGMKYYLCNSSILPFVIKEKKQKDSYYGLFEKLKFIN
ncbi:hypothetical protein [Flavobacterium sp. KACC 22761]|uniref:hypothetical protein n=1 Tax=Flavobacterium sp. KACC 22761 TaxID=3092665 RepID=UPI002A76551D|nr:hypothetical protein [Flavobacterium sp. KACC 22761]WPO77225.1 hypothetical protein SCB73_13225 [Flavobacterium sp. KACC 22761]